MTRTIPALMILGGVVAFIATLSLCALAARADDAIVKFTPVPLPPLNVSRQIWCMKQAEHWDGRAIGTAGERGAMQFKPATWADFSDRPLSWAEARTREQQEEAARVEANYVLWLMVACEKMGRKPTPYMLALLHNAGTKTVERGRTLARHRDFAQRVENLYYDADPR